MKKTIGVFGLFLLLLAFSVAAHNLDGVVTDDDTGLTVSGATVKVTYSGNTFTTSTGITGSFSLDIGNLTVNDYAVVFIQKSRKWNEETILLDKQSQSTIIDMLMLSHPQCSDLVDNDRDGRTDSDDLQCDSPSDNDEGSRSASGGGKYGIGVGMGITSETEDFEPRIWMCPKTSVRHNNADGNGVLVERVQNYAFQGEQIVMEVLVWDKNGIEKIRDVYMTISSRGQQAGDGSIEANCARSGSFQQKPVPCTTAQCERECFFDDFNARELEEVVEWNGATMARYSCTLTVESAMSMEGEYWVMAEVEDLDGLLANTDEKQYWFFNPMVAITVSGDIDFGIVRPGTSSYSDTILIENDAESGSGVLLDMSISGSDFYDPSSSGAKCPYSNVLELRNIRYYASNGAYKTVPPHPRGDGEGYYSIPYEVSDPDARLPIVEGSGVISLGPKLYAAGNVLTPGAEIALTFRLDLPEPCNGDFSEGSIYFWGEAI